MTTTHRNPRLGLPAHIHRTQDAHFREHFFSDRDGQSRLAILVLDTKVSDFRIFGVSTYVNGHTDDPTAVQWFRGHTRMHERFKTEHGAVRAIRRYLEAP